MATALTDFACMAWRIYRVFDFGRGMSSVTCSVRATLLFVVPETQVKCFVYILRARFLVLRIPPRLSRNGSTHVVCLMPFAPLTFHGITVAACTTADTICTQICREQIKEKFPPLSSTHHFSRFRLPSFLNFTITYMV